MSTPPSDPKAEREAIEWLDRLDAPCVPTSDVEAFHAWLNASEVNRRAFDAIKGNLDDVAPAAAKIYGEAAADRAARNDEAERLRAGRKRRQTIFAAAAAALVLAALFVPFSDHRPTRDQTTLTTAALELRAIELEDGSRMELSPLARADVRYTEHERRVALLEGVAYFEVVADPERPFVVATPFGEVRVRGSAFVVRIGQQSANVVVLRGAVEAGATRYASLWSRWTQANAHLLADADTEVRLADGEAQLESLDSRTRDQRVAWRERRIALEDMPLRDVADEVTRFSGVNFDILDEGLAQEHVSLFLEGGDVEGFLTLLESNLGVSVERRTDNTIVLRRRP